MRALRGNLVLRRGEDASDGTPTWTLFDPLSDKYYRLSEKERRVLESLDRPMEHAELLGLAHGKGISASPAEIASLDAFLTVNNLYVPAPASPGGFHRPKKSSSKLLGILSSILFFKIPLFRPAPFIAFVFERFGWLFSKALWWGIGAVSVFGYLRLPLRWNELAGEAAASINIGGALKYALCAAVIKTAHEFAHAFAAKASGIEVRKMGIAFIVLFPRFYTDVTDAWRLSDRKRRAFIDAAGILFELAVGGLAALAWSASAPGSLHAVSYYILAVTVVNTLFINGNPFIRYDGYYLLSDLVNIDNLRAKANAAFLGSVRKWLWGIPAASAPERGWRKPFLALYAVSSFAYRVFLYTSIIAVVYFKFTKALGLAMAAVEVYVLFVLPVHMEIRRVMAFKGKKRLNTTATAIAALSVSLVFLAPLPWTVSVPCEFVPLDSFAVTAPEGGVLEKVSAAANGGKIASGEVVAEISNPELRAAWRKSALEARKAREELRRAEADAKASGNIRLLKSRVRLMEEMERENREKLERLAIKAGTSGLLMFHEWNAGVGEWVEKGRVLGEIYAPDKLAAVGYVPERLVGKIRPGDAATAIPRGALSGMEGKVVSVDAAPVTALSPSPVLIPFGGTIHAVGTAEGKWRTVERLYPVVVELSGDAPELSAATGCSGTLEVKEYSSLLGSAFKWLLSLSRNAF
jgi:putative peptide zinc metalloprotease protein